MNGRLWLKVINYSSLDKQTIIELLHMAKHSDDKIETYISCRKLCSKCICKTNKYQYTFIKLDYENPIWIKEIGILNYLGHSHIQKISKIHITSDGYIYYSILHSTPIGNIDDKFIQKITHDIISGMAYLHQRDIIHGNISIPNFMKVISNKNSAEQKSKICESEIRKDDYKIVLTNFSDAKKIIPTKPIISSKYFYICDYSLSHSQRKNKQLAPELLLSKPIGTTKK